MKLRQPRKAARTSATTGVASCSRKKRVDFLPFHRKNISPLLETHFLNRMEHSANGKSNAMSPREDVFFCLSHDTNDTHTGTVPHVREYEISLSFSFLWFQFFFCFTMPRTLSTSVPESVFFSFLFCTLPTPVVASLPLPSA